MLFQLHKVPFFKIILVFKTWGEPPNVTCTVKPMRSVRQEEEPPPVLVNHAHNALHHKGGWMECFCSLAA